MSDTIRTVFLLNATLIGVVLWLCARNVQLVAQHRALLVVAFIAAPMFLAAKGSVSAVYLVDLFAPVLFYKALRGVRMLRGERKTAFVLLVLLLFVFPLVGTSLSMWLGGASSQMERRNLQFLMLWTYRNLIFLSVFVIGASILLEVRQFINHIYVVLMFGTVIALLGVIDYLGIRDLSIYEMIVAANNPDSSYHYTNTTLGWGFLGMFRGSVGQLFANLFCLSVPFMIERHGARRGYAFVNAYLCVVIVLCSLSRAGALALSVGVVAMSAFAGGRRSRLVVGIVAALTLMGPLLQVDAVKERLFSITTYAGSTDINRVDVWATAIHRIGGDITLLLFGNGATNRSGTAELIGAFGAHNDYLDAIFRGGVLALVILLMLLYTLFTAMWRVRRSAKTRADRIWLSVIPAMLISNIVIGFTQDHLFRDTSAFTVGIVMYYLYGLGMAVRGSKGAEDVPAAEQVRKGGRVVGVAGVGTLPELGKVVR